MSRVRPRDLKSDLVVGGNINSKPVPGGRFGDIEYSEDYATSLSENVSIQSILQERGIDFRELRSVKSYRLEWPELDEVVDLTKDLLLDISRVGVLYDVDADGLVSGKIVYEYMQKLGLFVQRMMNKRKKHGITDDVIDWVRDNEIELLYVVDAGTNDIEEHKILSEMGVHVIILDHHPQTVVEEVENVHVINCSLYDHLPDLSGAGVCYRYIELLDEAVGGVGVTHYEPWVGLSVLSDHCSMLDSENRYYVDVLYKNYSDIDLFNAFTFWGSARNLFLFGVIPYLNACIRTNNVDIAMEVMSMSGASRVRKFVEDTRDRVLDQQSSIISQMSSVCIPRDGEDLLMVRLPDSVIDYSGMSGLFANRLLNEYKKSVIVFYREGDYFRGSFRGYGSLVSDDLRECGLTVMGHAQAAGIEMHESEASVIVTKLLELKTEEVVYDYDFELRDSDIVRNLRLLQNIAKFNEMTGGNLPTIKFKLHVGREPFKDYMGKRLEYDFQSFRVRDFNLERDSSEDWVIEPLLDRDGIVLLRQ